MSEVEQVIITQFGKPVGDPVTSAGLKFKVPFIQDVNTIDKRILEWDGSPSDMPTKDKLYISVDLYARWRITDPLQYFLRLRDERSAQSRLDDILGSEIRNAVAKHELIEIIRTTKDRVPLRDALLTAAERQQDIGSLVPIQKGRELVEQEIFAEAAKKIRVFGIELLDIRFKRINYNESVRPKIYDRMISERRQIAERFLSEGNGEAARIRGNRVRDLNKIQSEAYRKVEEIRGVADAKATEIYAKAYNQSPEAVAFLRIHADHAGLQVHHRRKHDACAFHGQRPFQIPEGHNPEKQCCSRQPFGRQSIAVTAASKGLDSGVFARWVGILRPCRTAAGDRISTALCSVPGGRALSRWREVKGAVRFYQGALSNRFRPGRVEPACEPFRYRRTVEWEV